MKIQQTFLYGLFLTGVITPWSNANAVTADDVDCTRCITTSDLANNSISTSKIKNGDVRTADLADNSINTLKIKDGEVSEADLADNSITTLKIKDGEVKTDDLADNSINTLKIKNGEVREADLAVGSVTTSRIKDFSIKGRDIAPRTLNESKLSLSLQNRINTLEAQNAALLEILQYISLTEVIDPESGATYPTPYAPT